MRTTDKAAKDRPLEKAKRTSKPKSEEKRYKNIHLILKRLINKEAKAGDGVIEGRNGKGP